MSKDEGTDNNNRETSPLGMTWGGDIYNMQLRTTRDRGVLESNRGRESERDESGGGESWSQVYVIQNTLRYVGKQQHLGVHFEGCLDDTRQDYRRNAIASDGQTGWW